MAKIYKETELVKLTIESKMCRSTKTEHSETK